MVPAEHFTLAAKGNQKNNDSRDIRIVFFVGSQLSAHYILREVMPHLAALGLHCDVFFTKMKLRGPQMQERFGRPEARNLTFFEEIFGEVAYPILEKEDIRLKQGELINNLMYTPQQLQKHFADQGMHVNIEHIDDIQASAFHERMKEYAQKHKLVAVNIRNMQIFPRELIEIFDILINTHPGDAIEFPGTYIPFWERMLDAMLNIWTAHEITSNPTEKIDGGPIINQATLPLRNNDTLMHDMLRMRKPVGSMLYNIIIELVRGNPISLMPQENYTNRTRPQKLFTVPKHEDWVEANQKGIIAVDPDKFIKAVIQDFCGALKGHTPKLLYKKLKEAIIEWQTEYIEIYQKAYGYPPVELEMNRRLLLKPTTHDPSTTNGIVGPGQSNDNTLMFESHAFHAPVCK